MQIIRRQILRHLAATCLLGASLGTPVIHADDWAQWRGPNRHSLMAMP